MEKLQAINLNERIQTLDVIRGIAILGIFIVNIFDFSGPYFGVRELMPWHDSSNLFAVDAMEFFAEGGFYTLFSFLFGFGVAIFYERSLAKGVSFPYYFSRRIVALLAFGFLHAFLIWKGDILFNYACLAFVMMPMIRWSSKVLLRIAIALLTIDVIFIIAMLALPTNVVTPEMIAGMKHEVATAVAHYGHGTWLQILEFRFGQWVKAVTNVFQNIFMFTTVFPMFLLGAVFCKNRWLQTAAEHRRAWWTLLSLAGLATIVLRASAFSLHESPVAELTRVFLGGPAFAMTALAAITLAMTTERAKRLLAPFSFVGRMALTNYLLQSSISTAVFYHYGLNLYGKVQPVYALLYVVLFYAGQVVLSRLWLSRFKQGPFETVWRYFTYGTAPKRMAAKQAS